MQKHTNLKGKMQPNEKLLGWRQQPKSKCIALPVAVCIIAMHCLLVQILNSKNCKYEKVQMQNNCTRIQCKQLRCRSQSATPHPTS